MRESERGMEEEIRRFRDKSERQKVEKQMELQKKRQEERDEWEIFENKRVEEWKEFYRKEEDIRKEESWMKAERKANRKVEEGKRKMGEEQQMLKKQASLTETLSDGKRRNLEERKEDENNMGEKCVKEAREGDRGELLKEKRQRQIAEENRTHMEKQMRELEEREEERKRERESQIREEKRKHEEEIKMRKLKEDLMREKRHRQIAEENLTHMEKQMRELEEREEDRKRERESQIREEKRKHEEEIEMRKLKEDLMREKRHRQIAEENRTHMEKQMRELEEREEERKRERESQIREEKRKHEEEIKMRKLKEDLMREKRHRQIAEENLTHMEKQMRELEEREEDRKRERESQIREEKRKHEEEIEMRKLEDMKNEMFGKIRELGEERKRELENQIREDMRKREEEMKMRKLEEDLMKEKRQRQIAEENLTHMEKQMRELEEREEDRKRDLESQIREEKRKHEEEMKMRKLEDMKNEMFGKMRELEERMKKMERQHAEKTTMEEEKEERKRVEDTVRMKELNKTALDVWEFHFGSHECLKHRSDSECSDCDDSKSVKAHQKKTDKEKNETMEALLSEDEFNSSDDDDGFTEMKQKDGHKNMLVEEKVATNFCQNDHPGKVKVQNDLAGDIDWSESEYSEIEEIIDSDTEDISEEIKETDEEEEVEDKTDIESDERTVRNVIRSECDDDKSGKPNMKKGMVDKDNTDNNVEKEKTTQSNTKREECERKEVHQSQDTETYKSNGATESDELTLAPGKGSDSNDSERVKSNQEKEKDDQKDTGQLESQEEKEDRILAGAERETQHPQEDQSETCKAAMVKTQGPDEDQLAVEGKTNNTQTDQAAKVKGEMDLDNDWSESDSEIEEMTADFEIDEETDQPATCRESSIFLAGAEVKQTQCKDVSLVAAAESKTLNPQEEQPAKCKDLSGFVAARDKVKGENDQDIDWLESDNSEIQEVIESDSEVKEIHQMEEKKEKDEELTDDLQSKRKTEKSDEETTDSSDDKSEKTNVKKDKEMRHEDITDHTLEKTDFSILAEEEVKTQDPRVDQPAKCKAGGHTQNTQTDEAAKVKGEQDLDIDWSESDYDSEGTMDSDKEFIDLSIFSAGAQTQQTQQCKAGGKTQNTQTDQATKVKGEQDLDIDTDWSESDYDSMAKVPPAQQAKVSNKSEIVQKKNGNDKVTEPKTDAELIMEKYERMVEEGRRGPGQKDRRDKDMAKESKEEQCRLRNEKALQDHLDSVENQEGTSKQTRQPQCIGMAKVPPAQQAKVSNKSEIVQKKNGNDKVTEPKTDAELIMEKYERMVEEGRRGPGQKDRRDKDMAKESKEEQCRLRNEKALQDHLDSVENQEGTSKQTRQPQCIGMAKVPPAQQAKVSNKSEIVQKKNGNDKVTEPKTDAELIMEKYERMVEEGRRGPGQKDRRDKDMAKESKEEQCRLRNEKALQDHLDSVENQEGTSKQTRQPQCIGMAKVPPAQQAKVSNKSEIVQKKNGNDKVTEPKTDAELIMEKYERMVEEGRRGPGQKDRRDKDMAKESKEEQCRLRNEKALQDHLDSVENQEGTSKQTRQPQCIGMAKVPPAQQAKVSNKSEIVQKKNGNDKVTEPKTDAELIMEKYERMVEEGRRGPGQKDRRDKDMAKESKEEQCRLRNEKALQDHLDSVENQEGTSKQTRQPQCIGMAKVPPAQQSKVSNKSEIVQKKNGNDKVTEPKTDAELIMEKYERMVEEGRRGPGQKDRRDKDMAKESKEEQCRLRNEKALQDHLDSGVAEPPPAQKTKTTNPRKVPDVFLAKK
ncbi:trichohyalin-like [Oncorhynchus kisutch]|uniref:trichohyalin-like n=1 Tax=Oncorhynchus kisutch TaxID=8019 RepID=UPI0012DEFDF1|nr:trichohyalin-like [Oncorhynchus kisutch]